eukprot:Seg7867.2 transcript_id=Seg7867.2/GoldUCD/mRNA.D3Y31 product="39S ribosomal protein L49 mitochondrial" pseudo=true protein_id=Seg7867.2/GoldUCD/D3Y31
MLLNRAAAFLFKSKIPIKQCRCYCEHAFKYEIKPERLAEIQKSPSGWVPPLDSPPNLGFQIRRSRTNNLPVYTHYKNSGSRAITSVTKVTGDLKELERCLRYKLGDEEIYQINEVTSCVKVKGRHKKEVTKWLLELGF